MRSNFDELNRRRPTTVEDTIVNNSEYVSDTPPFDDYSEEEDTYFDLLSAYIDGEVDASERRQVQEWIDNDPRIHQLYTKMLRLHQAVDQIPVPPSSPQLPELVFQRLDQRRKGKFISLGVALIGAISLGMLTSLVVRSSSTVPKIAQEEGLMIALNYPVIDIPTSTSSKGISSSRK